MSTGNSSRIISDRNRFLPQRSDTGLRPVYLEDQFPEAVSITTSISFRRFSRKLSYKILEEIELIYIQERYLELGTHDTSVGRVHSEVNFSSRSVRPNISAFYIIKQLFPTFADCLIWAVMNPGQHRSTGKHPGSDLIVSRERAYRIQHSMR